MKTKKTRKERVEEFLEKTKTLSYTTISARTTEAEAKKLIESLKKEDITVSQFLRKCIRQQIGE